MKAGRGELKVIAVLFAVSLIVLAVAPWIGIRLISPGEVFDLRGGSLDTSEAKIFWQLRVPRIVMAWCAGATFGLCGMVFQALFRNPLAEPSLLGVSSGAAFGAAAAIRFGFGAGVLGSGGVSYLSGAIGWQRLFGGMVIPAFAFSGAILAVAIITVFTRLARGASDASLLLAGVAISSLFSSLIMVFQYTGGAVETYRLLSWTIGGISVVGMDEGLRAFPSLILAFALSLFCSAELDLITFGDEIAATRGVELERTKRILFVGMSLSVALVVANCGPIAFLGLISPHVARRVVGPRHRALAPSSAAIGGTTLVICDTAARTIWAPADLPVGIIISFLGAPFFLWLLFKPRER
ncbi:MAG: iron ABC transporter permease [Synergistaceae bacterium]|jgi:iron complex transport system permease protein|nr:iron ABC transporter permease [Synergistaceae bacterium]